jgi:hypothetical protein
MKKLILAPLGLAVLAFLLVAAAPPLRAASSAPAEAAEDAYYLALYLQHARGDLDGALRALEEARAAGTAALREDALRRQAEIERLRGNPAKAISTLAAAPSSPSADALGPARFFPPQMEVVAQVRLADLMAAPLVRKLTEDRPLPAEEIKKIAGMLGFDPVKDIQRLTVAATLPEESALALALSDEAESHALDPKRGRAATASATAHLELAKLHFLVVAEGRFAGFKDDPLLELARAAAIPGGAPVESVRVQGIAVSVATVEDGGQKARLGLCRPDDSTLIVGDMQSLEEMLAARAGQKPGIRDNPILKALIERVKPDAMVWVAAPAQKILQSAPELRDALRLGDRPLSLRGLLLASHLDRDLVLRATVSTEDAQSASVLSDIAKGAVALAQIAPVDKPEEKKILSSLKAESSEREVTVAVTVPGELIREHPAEDSAADLPQRAERSELRLEEGKKKTESRSLVFGVGKSARLVFKTLGIGEVVRVTIDDPKVANVAMDGPDAFSLTGLTPGETTVRLLRQDGGKTTIKVTVRK